MQVYRSSGIHFYEFTLFADPHKMTRFTPSSPKCTATPHLIRTRTSAQVSDYSYWQYIVFLFFTIWSSVLVTSTLSLGWRRNLGLLLRRRNRKSKYRPPKTKQRRRELVTCLKRSRQWHLRNLHLKTSFKNEQLDHTRRRQSQTQFVPLFLFQLGF